MDKMRPIAVYSLGLAGWEIMELNDEYATYRWSEPDMNGKKKHHRAKISMSSKGRPYFLAKGKRIYLDLCMVIS